MELYLDSSNPQEIETVRSWGVLSGVTTNPTLISQAGPDMGKTLNDIIDASPGPVLVQVVGWREPESLVAQARWLHALSDQIVVKLPMSIAGIQALVRLKQDLPALQVAVTAIASVAQAYLCGKAGADIAAVFNGPLDEAADAPVNLVGPIKTIYDNYGFHTRILSCGRFPRLFGQVAVAGTDICTMKIEYMRRLYEHPFTEQRMSGFTRDWESRFGNRTWLGEPVKRF